MPLLEASAQRPETLHRAGLAEAEAVVCAEREDMHTLEITLLVRQLRPDVRVVVSLNNPAVGAALEEVTGPGSLLSTASLAAPSLVEDDATVGYATSISPTSHPGSRCPALSTSCSVPLWRRPFSLR